MVLKKPKSGKTAGFDKTAGSNKPGAPAPEAAEPHGADLDRYDIAILHELQRDARLSNTELASRIGISAAPTWRRVKWLEEQGYIRGYRAEIDRRKIGLADRRSATAHGPCADRSRSAPSRRC